MTGWLSPLFFLFARSDEDLLRRQVLFLKAELEMTRKRVDKQRIFLTNDERERLLQLGDGIGSDVMKLVSIVHPRTYQRWRQRRSDGEQPAKRMGRKGTPETIRQLVVRLAKETGWGYGRIVAELRKLRIRCVGRTTVRTILKAEGVHPSPKRGKGTWDEFIKIHADSLWQCDFFSKIVVTKTGPRQAYSLAFLHVESRRVIYSPATLKPDDAWMVAQPSRCAIERRNPRCLSAIWRVIRASSAQSVDAIFEDAGVAIEPTAPWAPNQNAMLNAGLGRSSTSA